MPIHHPLVEARREIRLIQFVHDAPDDDTIRLHLRHVSLDDDPDFAALSYVWGDMRETVEAIVDGIPYAIGRNLHQLFLQLRRHKVDTWLWTDAICINQTDNDEKRWQINLMRDIYNQAASVHLWLGPGSAETDDALDFLADLGERAEVCDAPSLLLEVGKARSIAELVAAHCQDADSFDDSDPDHSLARFYLDLLEEPDFYADEATDYVPYVQVGMRDLLQRDYWTRMWIIQEVTVPRSANIACGDRMVPLAVFNAAISVIWACKRTFCTSIPAYRRFGHHLDPQMLDIRALNTRADYQTGESISLAGLLYIRDPAPGRPYYAVTEPRDIVFAVLGILSDGKDLGLAVDYTKTRAEIFTMLTRALILHSEPAFGGFGLDCVVPKTTPDGLPSWVVDWQAMGVRGTPQKAVRHQGLFGGWCDATTGGPSQDGIPQPDDAGSNILRQGGCRVDVISEVLEPPTWLRGDDVEPSRPDHPAEWLSSVEAFAKLDEASRPNPNWGATMSALGTAVTALDPVAVEHMARIEEPAVFRLICKMMLMRPVAADSLNEAEVAFLRDDVYSAQCTSPETGPLTDESIEKLADLLRWHWMTHLHNRTFFWTEGGKLGLCWAGVEVGDVLALVWNAPAPVVLREREHGFLFQGDAYVAGLMEGEFLEDAPNHEVFDIY
ncbi:hypothetical protein ACHAQA_007981 [Verticillium albo-atrum]